MQILVRRLEFALVQSKRTSSSLGSSLSRAPPPHYETLLQPHAFLFQHKVQVRKGGLMEERHREDNSQLSQIFGSNLSNLKLLLWASDRRRGQGVLAACKGGASCSLPRQAAMFRWMEQIQTSKVISLNPHVGVPTSV